MQKRLRAKTIVIQHVCLNNVLLKRCDQLLLLIYYRLIEKIHPGSIRRINRMNIAMAHLVRYGAGLQK